MIIFGNNWHSIFYKCLRDYGGASFLFFFSIMIVAKHVIFNIIVAFLLEHMKKLFDSMHTKSKKKYVNKINKLKNGLDAYWGTLQKGQGGGTLVNMLKAQQEQVPRYKPSSPNQSPSNKSPLRSRVGSPESINSNRQPDKVVKESPVQAQSPSYSPFFIVAKKLHESSNRNKIFSTSVVPSPSSSPPHLKTIPLAAVIDQPTESIKPLNPEELPIEEQNLDEDLGFKENVVRITSNKPSRRGTRGSIRNTLIAPTGGSVRRLSVTENSLKRGPSLINIGTKSPTPSQIAEKAALNKKMASMFFMRPRYALKSPSAITIPTDRSNITGPRHTLQSSNPNNIPFQLRSNESKSYKASRFNLNLSSVLPPIPQSPNRQQDSNSPRDELTSRPLINSPVNKSAHNKVHPLVSHNNANNLIGSNRSIPLTGTIDIFKKINQIGNKLTNQSNVVFAAEAIKGPVNLTVWERMRESSLFILHRNSFLRRQLQAFYSSQTAEVITSIFVTLSGIILAIDSPFLNPQSSTVKAIFWTEVIIQVCFSAEFVTKIFSSGMFHCSEKFRKPYFAKLWNWIDFTVLIIGWVSLDIHHDYLYLKCFMALRLLRLLRTLRAIGRSTTLNLIIDTILSSIGKMTIFFFFAALCIIPYSMIGMRNYPKEFDICMLHEPVDSFIAMACPANTPGNNFYNRSNFKNFWESLQAAANIVTGEGFKSMFRFLMIPAGQTNPSYLLVLETLIAYYFLSLILQNMFACVGILNFLEMKQNFEGTYNLNERERRIFELQRVFIKKRLIRYKPNDDHQIDGFFSNLISSFWYEIIFLCFLILNVSFMIVAGTQDYLDEYKIVQILLLIIYNIEIVLKVYILSFSSYWSDSFNAIDFTSTILCDLLFLIFLVSPYKVYFMAPILIRVLTLGRFLRRLLKIDSKISKGMKNMLDALQLSLISLLPMILIISIIVSAYSIIAMNLFYRIPMQDEVNEVFNFQYFSSSFLNLLK